MIIDIIYNKHDFLWSSKIRATVDTDKFDSFEIDNHIDWFLYGIKRGTRNLIYSDVEPKSLAHFIKVVDKPITRINNCLNSKQFNKKLHRLMKMVVEE